MSGPRVAVVSSYFPWRADPYRGHSAYQTLRRMTGWAQIKVFCTIAAYPRWRQLQPRQHRYLRPDVYEPPEDMQADYLEYPAVPLISRPINGWMCARSVEPHLRAFQPDVILNYWLYPDGWAAVRVARKLGVPAVVASIGSDLRRIPDPLTRHLTRRTLEDANATITVSSELRRRALELGARPESTVAIVNGCDTETFQPRPRAAARVRLGIDPGAELLVYVGNLLETKGLRELWQAFATLAQCRPKLEVVLVGEGPLRSELETRVRAAGMESRFRLAGRAASAEVAEWMAASNAFCLPSYSEGCPNVVVEALACGRPVIACDVGGIPELVDEACGVLLPPQNAERLAGSIIATLERPWDEALIGRRAKRSWDDCARETMDVLKLVLSR
jgi:teichuronic acid biosynthesis glycosyltransferase TuaC